MAPYITALVQIEVVGEDPNAATFLEEVFSAHPGGARALGVCREMNPRTTRDVGGRA